MQTFIQAKSIFIDLKILSTTPVGDTGNHTTESQIYFIFKNTFDSHTIHNVFKEIYYLI